MAYNASDQFFEQSTDTNGNFGNSVSGQTNSFFLPKVYSKQVLNFFRKSSVAEAVTNTDYAGEIAAFGDSVRIIKEPEISVKAYARGTQVTAQDLDDEDFTLTVDKSNYYAFKMDDIEEAHSHVNFMQLATDRAAYRLADQYDQEVLGYMAGYKQSALHANAGAVNDAVNGSVAVSTAGTDELLSSNNWSRESIYLPYLFPIYERTSSSLNDNSLVKDFILLKASSIFVSNTPPA